MKKRITFTLDEALIEMLKTHSKESMVPQARIVESALKKYLENVLVNKK